MSDSSEAGVQTHKTAQFAMRLDPCKKAQIKYTFKELGMTVSEAVNIYFEKCLSEWGIPF
ncbi:MAG: type II toxin-antitoxin system RelB/DinJ family antitoxin [Christensenellaceae bacterium]|nr:type II toxin-antitoxin system RelB/DinJ family antitoxin [Christensenellaceae bacterium]